MKKTIKLGQPQMREKHHLQENCRKTSNNGVHQPLKVGQIKKQKQLWDSSYLLRYIPKILNATPELSLTLFKDNTMKA